MSRNQFDKIAEVLGGIEFELTEIKEVLKSIEYYLRYRR